MGVQIAVALLIAALSGLSYGENAVCTDFNENEAPLCDGEVIDVYPRVDGNDSRKPLYFAFMQSFSGGYVSSGGIPGVLVALDEINANSSVLPGYTLHYTLSDNACVRSFSQDTLFKQLEEKERTKIAIIGSGCSLATEPSAEISHFFNIPQISCHSSSPLLRNRERFQAYFQTIGSEEWQGRADFGIIQFYGWRKVTILQLDVDTFERVTIELRDRLANINVTIQVKTFEENEGIAGLGDDPFGEDRIFAFIMYEQYARDLMCEAYRRGLRYPRFTFMHAAWWSPQWWRGNTSKGYDCTVEERESVVEHSLAVLLYEYIANFSDIAQTGLDGSSFMNKFNEHYENFEVTTLPATNPFGQACYDATWILTLALNNTLNDLSKRDSSFRIEDFSYTNGTNYLEIITRHLNETNFLGITGRIMFDTKGIRQGNNIVVYQNRYRNGNLTQGKLMDYVAIITEENAFSYVNGNNDDTLWPDGVTSDGIPNEKIITTHIAVTVIFVILAAAGVTLTILCLIFNCIFREGKYIKDTNPNLNYMLGIGALLLYLDVCIRVIPSTDPDGVEVICNISPWLTSIGFSFCFGTIMAKMVRTFYTSHMLKQDLSTDGNNVITKKKGVSNIYLALFVLALVVVDLVVLVIYTIVEGVRGNLGPTRAVHAENPSDIAGNQEVQVNNFIYICSSEGRHIALTILYGYKIVLQAATVIMALKTTQLDNNVQDSREIVVATYISSFVLVSILIFSLTIDDRINTYAALTSGSILISTTIIVVLIFLPMTVKFFNDPMGTKDVQDTQKNDMPKPKIEESSQM